MCWCDEYDITINRADEVMIHKRTKKEKYRTFPTEDEHECTADNSDIWYEIDPENLWLLIELELAKGVLRKRLVVDNIFDVHLNEE